MKLLIQRALRAHVDIAGQTVGAINQGLLVFIGITHSDTTAKATWLANKLINLRIFEDDQGKMNRSLLEVHGKALIVSQFTLYGNCSEGRRPEFTEAAPPTISIPLYEYFLAEVRKGGVGVETGVFGAKMAVSLVNDGPVTLILEK